MDTILTTKLQRLGELLAASPIDDEIKNVLLENAEQLTPESIDGLIASLEREQTELEEVEEIVRDFNTTQELENRRVTLESQSIVRKMVDDFLLEAMRENLKNKHS